MRAIGRLIMVPLAFVLGALPLMAMAGSLSNDLSPLGTLWQVFATAGFAGGFVYWLLAGRKA